MNKSDSIAKLAKALSLVQSELNPASKDAKNPFFKSSYSTLNNVWDACRGLLAANGLAVSQLNQYNENGVTIETVLMHESGEWISGEMFLPLTKHDAQGVGSAMSYGRRYGLAAIVGIVSDEDDDGNSASQSRQQQRPNNRQPEPPKTQPELTTKQRIIKAQNAIKDLGGKVEGFDFANKSEAEHSEELTALTDQYKRLKQAQSN